MDIHHITNKTVRGMNIKLVFFDATKKNNYNQLYVDLIENTPIMYKDRFIDNWFIKDSNEIEYPLKKLTLKITDNTAVPKNDERNIFRDADFNMFLENNGLLIETTEYNSKFIRDYITPLSIYKKRVNRPLVSWSCEKLLNEKLFAILLVKNEIVGKVCCEVMNKKEIENSLKTNEIMYRDMNLYISRVDIRLDYQGNGLCKPLLTYMIDKIKKLGYKQLFIENASRTQSGVPACICYFKSGIDNDYRIRFTTKGQQIKVMTIEDCFKKPIPKSYYYISGEISRRALSKLHKLVKTKKFKKLMTKLSKKRRPSSLTTKTSSQMSKTSY